MFKVEEFGGIVRVTMQRAPVNALNNAFIDAFGRILDELEAKPDLVVLHIRSNQRAFCAGADLLQVESRFSSGDGTEQMVRDIREFHRLFARIENLPCVTIAEIGGAALGGGFELALSCDLRIASCNARIGLPEARLGLIPGAGGTQRLTRLCGPGVAAQIILGCEVVDGETARELGMVQWAVAADALQAEADELARKIAGLSVSALQVAKRCMASVGALGADGFEAELQGTRELMAVADTRKRVTEFFAQ